MVHNVSVQLRRYGFGPRVVVLHGGPGALGEMAPVARELADEFEVLEPLQDAWSVENHLRELRPLINEATSVVGFSWGAMLALCFAARWRAQRLILIGCGTFDDETRSILRARRAHIPRDTALADYWRFDAYDPLSEPECERIDPVCLEAAWGDMIQLQAQGVYPQAFSCISAPVTMLHGAEDPHPGPAIYESLKGFIPQLRYVEFARCGHMPWIERHARDPFFKALRDILSGEAPEPTFEPRT